MVTKSCEGLTLIEIIVATVIGALVAGGTLMAFATSAKFATQVAPNRAEAAALAQQTLDRFRNFVAEGDPWLAPTPWTDDAIPTGPLPSIANFGPSRQYKVDPLDCDGDGTPGDCYQVQVKVQWTPPE